MTDISDSPATPVPAASLILIRDGAERPDGATLEVLLTERHGQMAVGAGAYVFPGGKVEPVDTHPGLCRSVADCDDLDYRICAIRETFEETGVVLAHPMDDPAQPTVARGVQARMIARMRDVTTPASFHEVMTREGLEPAVASLIPFAHWITPVVRARRFDTRFYLATMPADQHVVHDTVEAVEALWAAPGDMIDRFGHDSRLLMFPTRMSLGILNRARNVAEALEIAARQPVVPVLPQLEKRADGIYAHVPAEAGFGGDFFPFQLKERVPGSHMIKPQKA